MPSRQPPPSLDPARLLAAYTATSGVYRNRLQAAVRAAWADLGSWREPDIATFARRVAPAVVGGQRQIASLTDGYLAAMTSATLGVAYRPTGIPRAILDGLRGGVSPLEVYKRMGPTVWTALARGYTLNEAVGQGLARALTVAGTDLQLAKTHAVSYSLQRNDHVTGFERVPDGEACELCLLASTQRYHTADLMPIHDRCACDVAPIFGATDSGQIINEGLRAQLEEQGVTISRGNGEQSFYGRVGGSDVGVTVQDHGELGPVLTVAGQHFDGPDNI